jgi:hypothetical protein
MKDDMPDDMDQLNVHRIHFSGPVIGDNIFSRVFENIFQ